MQDDNNQSGFENDEEQSFDETAFDSGTNELGGFVEADVAGDGETSEPNARPTMRPRPEETTTSTAWDVDWTPHRLGIELQHVEEKIKELLGSRDPRRKRKFTGTRRWNELHEDMIQAHFGDPLDQKTIREIEQLISKRHALFTRLRFLAGTRPVCNS